MDSLVNLLFDRDITSIVTNLGKQASDFEVKFLTPYMKSDIEQTDTEYRITSDLPGTSLADIAITVDGFDVKITGKRELSHKTETSRLCSQERYSGTFSRVFTLPSDACPQEAKASTKDGVLTVTFPRKKTTPVSIKIDG